MIASFADRGTEDIFDGEDTRAARRTCPAEFWAVARRKLDMLEAAVCVGDLGAPPGNRLEALKGQREGQYSVRINRQYRICFAWTDEGARGVEIVDYH